MCFTSILHIIIIIILYLCVCCWFIKNTFVHHLLTRSLQGNRLGPRSGVVTALFFDKFTMDFVAWKGALKPESIQVSVMSWAVWQVGRIELLQYLVHTWRKSLKLTEHWSQYSETVSQHSSVKGYIHTQAKITPWQLKNYITNTYVHTSERVALVA